MILDHDVELDRYVEGPARSKAMVVAEDMSWSDWINTGVIFVRTDSDWVRDIWSEAWTSTAPRFHHAPFWDQSALCHALAKRGEFRPDVLGATPPGWMLLKSLGSAGVVDDCRKARTTYAS